jgi:hypothetical protein
MGALVVATCVISLAHGRCYSVVVIGGFLFVGDNFGFETLQNGEDGKRRESV